MLRLLLKNDGVWGVLVAVGLTIAIMATPRPWSFLPLSGLLLYVMTLLVYQGRMASTIEALIGASDSMVRQMEQTNVVLEESRKALEESLNGDGKKRE